VWSFVWTSVLSFFFFSCSLATCFSFIYLFISRMKFHQSAISFNGKKEVLLGISSDQISKFSV
jgi:hypothetical protein